MKCSIRDLEIHYEDIGSGRPVIMLHGFGLDHRVMLGCMEPILKRREGWRRIYPDLPGMGGTEARDWIADSDGMLDVVLEFIDAVVPGEDFVLAGESYGGYLTLGALHRRAGSVKGLLLICPVLVPDHPKRTLPRHATIFKEPGLGVGSSEEEQMFKSMAVVRDSRHWKRFQEEILPGARAADGGFLEAFQRKGYPFSFDVSGISFAGPTLVLLGRQDSVVGFRDALSFMDNFPRGTFAVIDRAGHDLQIEQEGVFNALVGEWLDRVEAEAA
jgi:pimeloyl-ACP methyl ester carboxylesterase